MNHNEVPVMFKRDGLQLVGLLHVPQATRPQHPAVLLLHGFTGHKAETHFMFTRLARTLCQNGFVVLRFDFAGSGDSQGEFQDMTIMTELADARAALKFLRERPEVEGERIGLLGLSMGGCVAALLVGESTDVKSLVLWSAVAHPEEQFQLLRNQAPKVSTPTGWVIDLNGLAVGNAFFDILPQVKPLETIQQFQGPVLIIHGDKDMAVPPSAAEDYYATLKNRQAPTELYWMKDADHVFSTLALTQQVITKTVEWFNQTLKK
ncbi:MAG: alpha/beta fold hydrolase [candidate division KSB1 bacterium]|nr:alpha/beta fold hydrolase [candidate division KSB1 bacterium]